MVLSNKPEVHKSWHEFRKGGCEDCGYHCEDCPIGVATCKCKPANVPATEENKMTDTFNLEKLKEVVVQKLITEHDFLSEQAETAVDESVSNDPGMWHENTDVDSLVKYLAEEDDDA